MGPRIKFCGMTRPEDIEVALALGVDFLGLILVPESPRALDARQALALRRQIGSRAQVVLLTRDAEAATVATLAETLAPDVLQFHGREDAAFCAAFGRPWWKAVPMGELVTRTELDDFERSFRNAHRLLFDSHGGAIPGAAAIVSTGTASPTSPATMCWQVG
ncbi:MAG: phosphoribosylanthranilate isomerase [Ahniella sp.]|nr:phosphoribosylanthranilate isomerase [Ahniella sp.]